MSLLGNIIGGIRALFHKKQAEQDMNEELRSYLDAAVKEKMRSGMSHEQALRAARVEMGSMEAVKENIRSAGWETWVEALGQDVRYGLRTLRNSPGFTIVAIITLAFGIGASTAMFSVVSAVLLRPLPYRDPDRLVYLWETNLKHKVSQMPDSYADFLDWRSQNHVFESMALDNYETFTLVGPSGPVHVEGLLVSANLFDVLGVSPALGRGFLPEEDQPGHPVAIISHNLWQQSFSSSPAVLGRTVRLDHSTFTVVGVMPAGFQFPLQAKPVEVWVALGGEPALPTNERGNHSLGVIARLRPQVSLEQARAEMAAIAARIATEYPNTNKNLGVRIVPAHEELTGDVRPAVLTLFGAVLLVLLIACGNVANLLLARGTNREREIAIRAAIGAGRPRIVRQLLTESLVLAGLGGALGALLAVAAMKPLVMLGPQDIPRLSQITVNGHVLIFDLVVTFLTGLIFGAAPALRTARTDLIHSLKTSGTVTQDGPSRFRLRSALIVGEMALTLSLLAGAGLMLNSFFRLTRIRPGFNPKGVLTFAVDLSDADYTDQQTATRFAELLEAVRQRTGVRTVAADTSLPLAQIDEMSVGFNIEGQINSESPGAMLSIVTPDYFRTVEIPLLQGRDFSARDDMKSPPVVIVSQSLVRKYFPGQNALGKRLTEALNLGDDATPREIIGVVGDVRRDNLRTSPPSALYLPESQLPSQDMRFVLRSTAPLPASVDAVRAAVWSVDRNLPVYDIQPLDQYLGLSIAPARFNTLVLSLFALLAVVLSAVGLYGVISYTVSRRTHEFGLRLALGATRGDVIRAVLREGFTLALIGIGAGLGGALALTRFLANQLYEVKPADPLTFLAASAVFVGIALCATYIPARHATKVDPMVALRYE